MASNISFLALVLAVLVLSVQAQDADPEDANVTCRRREKYSECGSSCTEPKCESNDFQVCPAVCRPGCYCKNGTSRNKFGNCVPNYMCVYINYIG